MAKRPAKRLPSGQDRREKMRRAWEMYVQFKTESEIAKIIGVNQSTICRWLKELDSVLWDEFVVKANRIKAEDTFRLEKIIREAYAGWQRSLKDAETIVTETGGKHGDKTRKTIQGQSGDPRFLEVIRAAMADRRKIWGAERPDEEGDEDSKPQDSLDAILAKCLAIEEVRRAGEVIDVGESGNSSGESEPKPVSESTGESKHHVNGDHHSNGHLGAGGASGEPEGLPPEPA